MAPRRKDPILIFNGKPLAHWLRRLDVAASESDRKLAEAAVSEIGANAVPELVNQIQRGGRAAQRAAAAFAVLEERGAAAVSLLAASPGPEPTYTAHALAAIGCPASDSLIGFLAHAQASVRSAGAEGVSSLARAGRLSRDQRQHCVELLIANAQEEHPHVCARSLEALGYFPEFAERSLLVVTEGLERSDYLSQCAALQALKHFSPLAAPLLLRVTQMLASEDSSVRVYCVRAICRTPSRAAFQTLLNLASDRDVSVRGSAIEGLGFYPQWADESVPLLVERLRSGGSASDRWNAVSALGSLGSVARNALPILREFIERPNEAGGPGNIQTAIRRIAV